MLYNSIKISILGLSILMSSRIACAAEGSASTGLTTNNGMVAGLQVVKEAFGKMPDGTPVDKYTLTNVHKVQVSILTFGGIVQSIGRYGNRIAKGQFALAGKQYQIPTNDDRRENLFKR
jgi:hypothetical protein